MAKTQDKDPELVRSDHSGPFEMRGHTVEVCIFKIAGSAEWTLEVVDQHGTSTVWDEVFSTDEDAWLAFMRTIAEEGIEPLVERIERRHVH